MLTINIFLIPGFLNQMYEYELEFNDQTLKPKFI